MRVGRDVLFVAWTSAVARKGRRVRIDHLGRMVSIVPFAVLEQCFLAAVILVRDVGLRMTRTSQRFRLAMTPFCLVLQEHCRAQRFSGPLADVDVKCISCHELKQRQQCDDPPPPPFDLHRCSKCSVVWHAECAKELVGFVSPSQAAGSDVFVCHACDDAPPL